MNKNFIEIVMSLPVNTFTGEDIHDIFLKNLWFNPAKFAGNGITFGIKAFRKKYFDDVRNLMVLNMLQI